MTLIVCPRGRGRWNHITLKLEGPFDMLSFIVGEKLDLGRRQFWIVAVSL